MSALWIVAWVFLAGFASVIVLVGALVIRDRMAPPPPRPTYFVKHPDGSFTEADPQP